MALVQTGGSPATWGHLHSNLKQSFDAQALKLQASRARVQVADEALKALTILRDAGRGLVALEVRRAPPSGDV